MMDALRTGDMEVMLRKLDHGFFQHLRRDHIPYRRDCRACLAGYYRGHVHRRVAVPDGWCLSLDLIGPFKEGENEDGTKAKYGLVGVLVVPDILDEIRLDLVGPAEDDRDVASEGEEPDENPFHQEEDKEEEDGDDDFSCKDVAAERAEKMKWEALAEVEKVDGAKAVEVPFFVPLRSKKAPVVLKGVAEMVMQIQILGLTVRRIHSDRGREFNNEALKKFCGVRSFIKTTTTGDDYKMNGRCEGFIGRGKNAVRTLLMARAQPARMWAFAFRHHVAHIQQMVMSQIGLAKLPMPPFGTKVYVKRCSWKCRVGAKSGTGHRPVPVAGRQPWFPRLG